MRYVLHCAVLNLATYPVTHMATHSKEGEALWTVEDANEGKPSVKKRLVASSRRETA